MSAASKRAALLLSLLLLPSLLLSACLSAWTNDLLGEIQTRGTLRISTDPNYAPQSALIKDQRRAANTKCGADELTANQLEGFDIDTAVEIARRLHVEPCFVTPDWDTIPAGDWGGRWDVSVGSMTITKDRQKALWFSPAYYFTPAQVAARKGAGITSLAGLDGQPVCVGSGTTYETYLNGGDVGIPDSDIKAPPPHNVKVIALRTDSDCTQALQDGRAEFNVIMTASNVIDKAIADGASIEKIGPPIFVENLAVAIDKKAPKDPRSLFSAIDKIIVDMHADGTLKSSSLKWFGIDRTVVP